MKIIYCIAGTYNAGGMERVLANKANFLVEAGHEVLLVTTDQKARPAYFAMDQQIRHIDLAVNYEDDVQKPFLLKALAYFIKQRQHQAGLTKLLLSEKATIVISMFDQDASFLYRIPDGSSKVLEIHFSRFKKIQYGRKGIWKLINRYRNYKDLRLARLYDRFVVLTQEDKGYWGSLPNIQVIPNAQSFVPQEAAQLQAKRVIAVGRYDYQKGFDDLIHIWNKVNQFHKDWELAIYGGGPMKRELEELKNKLGLQDKVHLCAPVKEIEQIYMNGSILAMTSRYEGLPMVLIEGQSCGLPVVSYACKCGPRDMINDGQNGFLINEGDRDTFAAKIIQLIEDAPMRVAMGKEARENAQHYHKEKVMAQWLAMFNELKASKS